MNLISIIQVLIFMFNTVKVLYKLKLKKKFVINTEFDPVSPNEEMRGIS